ncbi:Porin subfamily protein [Rhizobiales bacterium GAS188]|nr:Porin subfamily protein [Rhizobiales bacterium GAS188]
MKGLLLTPAACVVATVGTKAADLPSRNGSPIDHAQICAVHGPGFFYIPDSDTCIRIGGRARFEYVLSQTYRKDTDPSSFRALGRLVIDARTQTDWDLLRADVRIDFSRDTGNNWFGSGNGTRAATRISFPGPAGTFPSFNGVDTVGNRLQTGLAISNAFVQWGGLTAGRIQSFFDFYAGNDTWFGITDSKVLTQALAYTYSFGSGFSATLAVEDPKERQLNPIAGTAPIDAGGILQPNPFPGLGSPFTNFSINYPPVANPFAAPFLEPGGINYTQRENVPDIVGVLRVDRGWGSAQLSGAYHRIGTSGSMITGLAPSNFGGPGSIVNPLVPTLSGGYGRVTRDAWAFQGGVKVGLPYFATGDHLYLQAAYSKGNISYADSDYGGIYIGQANSIGRTTFSTYDAVIGPTGRIKLTPATSAMASLVHYWTPTIRQGIFGGFAHIGYSRSIRAAAGFAAGAACPICFATITTSSGTLYNPFNPNYSGGTQYNIGTNLIWSPIQALDIGGELFYARNQMAHKEFDVNRGNGLLTKEDAQWYGRLRVSRDF